MNLSACSERASLNSPLKLAASSFALLAWVTIPKNWPQLTFLLSQYVPFLTSSLSASTSLLSLRFFSLRFFSSVYLSSLSFYIPSHPPFCRVRSSNWKQFRHDAHLPPGKDDEDHGDEHHEQLEEPLDQPLALLGSAHSRCHGPICHFQTSWRQSETLLALVILELVNVTNDNELAWNGRQFHHCNYAIVSSTASVFRWSKVDFKSIKHLIAIFRRCRIF